MTDDEIIGIWQRVCQFPDPDGRLLTITREDALQVSRALLANEREACAKVCDERGVKFFPESPFAAECHGLATAIRSRT